MSHLIRRTPGRLGIPLAGIVFLLAVAPPAFAVPDYDGDGHTSDDCKPLDGSVHPGAADKPDLSFEDTNCDGIDGDAAKAVFVSASAANDSGTGSKENPLKTFSAAITKAKAEGKDVYAMGGTYEGGVAVDSDVGIYGGYKPVTGQRANDEVTLIKGSPQAILANGDTNVVLQLVALEATADGSRSAYGLRAINGSSVALQKVTSTAGNGTPGSDGVNGTTGKNGENGSAGSAGACKLWDGNPGPRASGGAGGDSFIFFPFIANLPGHDGGDGGLGGAFSNPATAGGSGLGPDGQSGGAAPSNANGNSGTAGTSAPATPPAAAADGSNATFQATSNSNAWNGFPATPGTPGAHGSGGGAGSGGAVRSDTSSTGGFNDAGGGGGGGGGEGGAGGGAGGAGAAGGGSFGVYAHNSSVVVDSSKLTTGDGGNGGNGGVGANGGARGTGAGGGAGASCNDGDGSAETGGSGGPGGHGQPGGRGGSGGGGVGGPSFGIYVSGTGEFVSKNNEIVTGTPGLGGVKGGTTNRADSGQTGAAAGGTESTSSDFDADGVADVSDACPSQAGNAANGCPERAGPLADGDGDGVPDNADKCPSEPGGATDSDGDGCPGSPAVDADGDGSPAGVDCNDNNPGIRPGAVDIPNNGVDEDCANGDATAKVSAAIDNFWKWNRKYTRVTKLAAKGMPANSRLEIRCSKKGKRKGSGCKFSKKTLKVSKGGSRNLTKYFNFKRKGRKVVSKLRKKTVVKITITAPNHIGQVVKFKMRRNKTPKAKALCTAVGSTRAQKC